MGLLMAGTASEKAEEMLAYAHETQHEKIIRGLALGIALTMYGREEEADTLIEQMTRDQDPIIRYGSMYALALAYGGTANNKAIRQLLHFAVSDVSDDVRRTAVLALGFVLYSEPEQSGRSGAPMIQNDMVIGLHLGKINLHCSDIGLADPYGVHASVIRLFMKEALRARKARENMAAGRGASKTARRADRAAFRARRIECKRVYKRSLCFPTRFFPRKIRAIATCKKEMEQRRKRPLEQEQGLIKLSVKGQDGVGVYFQISRTQSMLKLLQTYCVKRNVEYKTMRFLYNGERFPVKHSPDELGFVENDEIEALMYQTGGGTVATENASQ